MTAIREWFKIRKIQGLHALIRCLRILPARPWIDGKWVWVRPW